MGMTDPIADMLTRMRNALRVERPFVDVPSSKVKIAITEVLQREGFIAGFEFIERPVQNDLRLHLKYGRRGERVISTLRRVSRPGQRIYKKAGELRPVLNGLGIAVLSTNKGVLSDREAQKAHVGGELLCEVW